MLNEHTQVSVTLRKKRVLLKREWLHGLLSWAVFDEDKKVGWVLKESEGNKWGFVTPEDDIYDDILYDFTSRTQALEALVAG